MGKILFTTTLFFNKVGNQSLLETVKAYSKYYEVHVITSSSAKNDYYLSLSEAAERLPANVYLYRTPQFFHDFFRLISSLVPKRRPTGLVDNKNEDLINLRYSYLNILSFKLAAILTCIYVFFFKILKRDVRFNVVCAYEIGAVSECLFIKKYMYRNAFLMAKMQGTVLMPILEEFSITPDLRRKYILDFKAYEKLPQFNLVTMTNDGTRGDEVLRYFGVKQSNIAFLMNGVSESIVKYDMSRPCLPLQKDMLIRICTISRIIGWKRVYLSVEFINVLVNKFCYKNVRLVIYGKGEEAEVRYVKKLISDYQLGEYVSIKGEVNHEDVPDVICGQDFLISLYKYTNVTNPLLEAVYLGTPVITLSDSSLSKILQHNPDKNIFIFNEEGDETQLLNDLAKFLISIDIIKIRERRQALSGLKPDSILSWMERVRLENEHIKRLCS